MRNLTISCRTNSEDATMFVQIINQGIDARLEAFTESEFTVKDGRLFLSFHPAEAPILLRRLCELYDEYNTDADYIGNWISDIVNEQYAVITED